MKYLTLRLTAVFILCYMMSDAQVYSNLESGKKNIQVRDSLKAVEYPYALPILGKKAAKAGFSLPYSAGIGVNYIWTKAEVVMDNLQIGFNGGPPTNMDEIVRFDNVTTKINGVNIRPDIWVFPFLNVYGIFAQGQPVTDVKCGIYIPDNDGNYTKILDIHAQPSFPSTSAGFGMTPTIGVRTGWMAFDMNITWTDTPALEDPTFAVVFGPRMGKSFKLKKPESNIAFWVGAFRLKLSSSSTGSIILSDLIDTSGLQGRVDNAIIKVDEAQVEVDTWWSGLTPIEQRNPVNKAKYETANRAISTAGEFLGNMNSALNDEENASVQFSVDKKPANMWNFIVGAQYQFNKHLMLRTEYGFLGTRSQFIGGLQYRFGL